MAELKTQPTKASVTKFIAAVPDERRRSEARTLLKVFKAATGKRPVMWGPSIVGYGRYHYRYASGQEGDWFLAGFSPRKAAMTVYVMAGFKEFGPLLKKLGKHRKSGGGCLYLTRLEDVDLEVLDAIIRKSVAAVEKRVTTLSAT
ncbi:MAG TPA: DUF1801 domain-containing protein [Gemmatimonadales bacterium]|nr:DUF1801 domain-containing protein [Gemmatimonadales bacterium]